MAEKNFSIVIIIVSIFNVIVCVVWYIYNMYMGISSMNGRDENNDVMNGARKKEDTLSVYYYFISGIAVG